MSRIAREVDDFGSCLEMRGPKCDPILEVILIVLLEATEGSVERACRAIRE